MMRAAKPHKICLILDKIALRSGGAERVLIETANALSARGFQVEIVTHEVRGKPPFYPLDPGVILSNIRPRNENRLRPRRLLDKIRNRLHRNRRYLPLLDRLQWLSEHGSFWRRLEKHLEATAPDVAIAFLPNAVVALGLANPRCNVRKFASLHNVPAQDFDNPARWDPNPIDRDLRKSVLDNFDIISVLLPEFREWFPEALQKKLCVIPNVVDPIGEDGQSPLTGKKVVSVGRLADVKRHSLLIDAWAKLPDELEDWTCEIYGVGPLEAALKAQISALGLEGKVKLMGHTTDMAAVYKSASVLAHPAEFEGFGLVITEALARGVPVVGFEDCPGFNSLIEHDKNGLFVSSSGDRATNLSEMLGRIMGDETLCQNLGSGGPVSIEKFAPERILDLWEAAITGQDVADSAARG